MGAEGGRHVLEGAEEGEHVGKGLAMVVLLVLGCCSGFCNGASSNVAIGGK